MDEPDRRQQILEAALQTFSEKGYHKTSIRDIARAAQIKSSALLYWYFKDKRELFNAVITELSPLGAMPFFHPEARKILMEQSPEELLRGIALNFLAFQDNEAIVRVMRLYFSEAVTMPDVAEVVANIQLAGIEFFTQYLDHQIALGRLRPHNTQASARAFMGTLFIHLIGNQIFTLIGQGFPDRETYVDEVINLFLRGLSHD